MNEDALRAEVQRLQSAEMAPLTRYGYAVDWRAFSSWCEKRNRILLPASPETVSLFVADQLTRLKIASVARQLAGVAFTHRENGYASPVDDSVRKTLGGARRLKRETVRQMRPLTVSELRMMSRALEARPGAIAVRDRAIVLTAFASALRRTNLVRLDLADMEPVTAGLLVRVRCEKNDRRGAGRLLALPYGAHRETCAVRAIEDWLIPRGREPGPLFVRLDNGRRTPLDRLSSDRIWHVVKLALTRAGIDATGYGPHSLRAGFISEAGIANAGILAIASTTGHRSLESLQRYFRPVDLFRLNVCGLIGL